MNNTAATQLKIYRSDNWIVGVVAGHRVDALMFDEDSAYGMEEDGRISKLWIQNSAGVEIYSFDRGDLTVGAGLDYMELAPFLMALDEAIRRRSALRAS